ncbi:hypothetical protein FJZ18_01560 [Candidatus Pacearchaeota archaeon]|nr:hypothetical protein [Candidatus Pacearchaeota archaeon]
MNIKNLVLGIGIFIVYLLAVGYGIATFYPSPDYQDFCKNDGRFPYYAKPIDPSQNCTFSRTVQEQTEQCYANQGIPIYEYNDAGCTIAVKTCDYCNKEFNNAQKSHQKIVFIIALIVGIITIFVGYGILSVEPVGSALMASGIGAIFYGSARNWANLTDIWRFLLLIAALILLIWITLNLNKSKSKR